MALRFQFAAAAALLLSAWSAHAGSTDKNDISCAGDTDGGCVPATSASLLQKVIQHDMKTTLAQEPTETKIDAASHIKDCTGTTAQDRCWYLSELGESCAAVCSKYGRRFSYTIADNDAPVTPKLVHHEPRMKQEPWAALECYVPSEDRYHPANENAARHFVDDIGNWSHLDCKLACPCGGPESENCTWKQPSICVPEFMWKGVEYSGCATVDTEHEKPWCQHHYQHTEKDTDDWSYCKYGCEEEVPVPVTPAPKEDQNCSWQPTAACEETFEFKGMDITGCTEQDHPNPWCSHDRVHKGDFDDCTLVCSSPPVPAPSPKEPEKPTNTSAEPCDRDPDGQEDFIGDSVTLDEVGYKIVTHVPSADSPVNMKRFVCRVVEDIGCKVTGLKALTTFVPALNDHSYGLLEYELTTLCQAGDSWVVPLDAE